MIESVFFIFFFFIFINKFIKSILQLELNYMEYIKINYMEYRSNMFIKNFAIYKTTLLTIVKYTNIDN